MCSTVRVISKSSSSCSSVASGMVSSFVGGRAWHGAASWFGASVLRLQVPIHEIDLLQAAQALADLLRSHLADALDSFEVGVGGCEQVIHATELGDDVLHDDLGEARDAPQDPEPTGGHRIVKGVELAV